MMGTMTSMSDLAFRVVAKYKGKKKTELGNTVYLYSERQIANRNKRKAKQIEKLRKSIHELRSTVKKDLKSSDPEKLLTALVVSLIDHTYERVGNDESAKDGHFGVTGWKRKHVSFGSKGAVIKYVGKSGVKHEKKISDAAIKQALRDAYEAVEEDNDELFAWDGGRVTAEKVNSYLKQFDITAKDLRGFHANREMQERLKRIRGKGKELPEEKKAKEKLLKTEFNKALEETAEAVGHEASTLRSQYLVPGLEESFLKDGSVISKFGSILVLSCGCAGDCGGACSCGGGCSCTTYDRRL
jgi:DNA topoisomerase I